MNYTARLKETIDRIDEMIEDTNLYLVTTHSHVNRIGDIQQRIEQNEFMVGKKPVVKTVRLHPVFQDILAPFTKETEG